MSTNATQAQRTFEIHITRRAFSHLTALFPQWMVDQFPRYWRKPLDDGIAVSACRGSLPLMSFREVCRDGRLIEVNGVFDAPLAPPQTTHSIPTEPVGLPEAEMLYDLLENRGKLAVLRAVIHSTDGTDQTVCLGNWSRELSEHYDFGRGRLFWTLTTPAACLTIWEGDHFGLTLSEGRFVAHIWRS